MKKRIVMDVEPELVARLNVVKAASYSKSWEQFLKKKLPILEATQELTDKILKKFTEREKMAILASLNGLLLTPELLGHHLQVEIEDDDSIELQVEGVDIPVLLEKIKKLDRLERALIELWGIGWWQTEV